MVANDSLDLMLSLLLLFFTSYSAVDRGSGSSVGIATDYGLKGPGSNPGGDEIFRPSRPVLWPTQPAVHNGYRVFPGGKVRPGLTLLVPRSWKSRAVPLLNPWATSVPVTGSLYLYLYFAVDYALLITVQGSGATTGVFDRWVDYCSFVQETEGTVVMLFPRLVYLTSIRTCKN